MTKQHLIGSTQTAFELHSFHSDQWLVVKEAPELRLIEPAAALLVQRQEVDGIRLVRRTDYLDHDFSLTVTVLKRLRPGVQETDPLLRANPGRDASWCDKPEDLYGDVQRQVIRGLLAKYLDERRVTPLEVLHYEVHAKALDQAGTTVQGALQRLASQQVRGTKQSAQSRMKELIIITEDGLTRLVKAAKNNPPLPVLPAGLAALFDKAPGAGDAERLPTILRAVAAHLAGAKTWVEKLDQLFQLWDPDFTVREMRILDSLAAEILTSPLALKELAGQEGNRLELVIRAIDLYTGKLAREEGEQPLGVKALSTLLAEGVLPRTMAELRLGLLRHLHARIPLRSDSGLREEMRATAEVLTYLRDKAPALARDEEVLEALAVRADRLIQPEAMSDMLGRFRTQLSRIDTVLTLVEEVPGDPPKAKLAPYLRSLISPEDMIREYGSRVESIKMLADVARRVHASGLPAGPKREMLEMIDSAVFDTIRTEILGNTAITFTDRILMILRLCSGMVEGRAKQLASDTLNQALRRPEFILNYLERFPGAGERRNAYFKLCEAMMDSGLVDKSLVPSAA
ncbi:MAG: hypothetical protein RLY86_2799 [Pseudomonadota bacterium]